MRFRFGIGTHIGPFFLGASVGKKYKPPKVRKQRIQITYRSGSETPKKRWRDGCILWYALSVLFILCFISGLPMYISEGLDGSKIAALLLMVVLAVWFFMIGQKNRAAARFDEYGEDHTEDQPVVAQEQQNALVCALDPMAELDHMDGHQFEYWCASLLENLGYQNVSVTPGSGDQGVDVLAEKDDIRYAIQCKCYSSDLGNKSVQEVHTGKTIYHCQVGVVMTNRFFTQGAKDAAAATGVLLWDRSKLRKMLESVSEE